jgi:DNA-binding response OmpR family regulator
VVKGAADDRSLTVLIAEDDSDTADALVTHATKMGFRPLRAETGLLALEIAFSERPDAVLLDINLPGLDGRDVFVRLKDAGLLEKMVVIFTTGRASHQDHLTGLKLGADGYEAKPYILELLFRKVQRQVDKKRNARSATSSSR